MSHQLKFVNIRVLGLLFLSMLAVVCTAVTDDSDLRAELRKHKITKGQWSAWIEMTPATDLPLRAIPFSQVVFRKGPNDSDAVRIFEETSTGRLTIALGVDGVLLVNPVSQKPRVYFPDPKKMVVIPLLPPQQWNKPFTPYYRLSGSAWFLGDVLFYGRFVYIGHYVIGYVRFDTNQFEIIEQRLVAEVKDDPAQTKDTTDGAYFAEIEPVRVKSYIFWKNRGARTADPPWRESRIRVVDIVEARLLEIGDIDSEFLEQHRDVLGNFLSK